MPFNNTDSELSVELESGTTTSGQILLQRFDEKCRFLDWLIGCAWTAHHGSDLAIIEWSPDDDADVANGDWYPYPDQSFSTTGTLLAGTLVINDKLQPQAQPRAMRYRLRWAVTGGATFTAKAFRTNRV